MLTQANHWLEIANAALDALLLGRIFLLKLHRLYLFITLACLLAVFFDGVQLWFEADQEASTRIFLYTRFLYAIVFPLIAYDVFEEMMPQIAKLRRLGMGRLISGLFLATIFGFIVSLFVGIEDTSNESFLGVTLGLVLWAGSSTATLAYLWSMQKALHLQKLERPHNTFVWMRFWQLTLLAEVASCFYILLKPLVKDFGADVVDLIFLTYGVAITGWCIVRLRGIPSDVPTAPANANL